MTGKQLTRHEKLSGKHLRLSLLLISLTMANQITLLDIVLKCIAKMEDGMIFLRTMDVITYVNIETVWLSISLFWFLLIFIWVVLFLCFIKSILLWSKILYKCTLYMLVPYDFKFCLPTTCLRTMLASHMISLGR